VATKASNTDFWIGTGIFKLKKDNDFQELILSKTQLDNVKEKIVIEKSTNEELKQISNNFNTFPYIK